MKVLRTLTDSLTAKNNDLLTATTEISQASKDYFSNLQNIDMKNGSYKTTAEDEAAPSLENNKPKKMP